MSKWTNATYSGKVLLTPTPQAKRFKLMVPKAAARVSFDIAQEARKQELVVRLNAQVRWQRCRHHLSLSIEAPRSRRSLVACVSRSGSTSFAAALAPTSTRTCSKRSSRSVLLLLLLGRHRRQAAREREAHSKRVLVCVALVLEIHQPCGRSAVPQDEQHGVQDRERRRTCTRGDWRRTQWTSVWS